MTWGKSNINLQLVNFHNILDAYVVLRFIYSTGRKKD